MSIELNDMEVIGDERETYFSAMIGLADRLGKV